MDYEYNIVVVEIASDSVEIVVVTVEIAASTAGVGVVISTGDSVVVTMSSASGGAVMLKPSTSPS